MRKDFDEIILCIPAIGFLVLNLLHAPASFFVFTENTALLLTVAGPTVIMELVSLIPLIAAIVFVFIFKSEILPSLFTLGMVVLYIVQIWYFWQAILPIMITYLPAPLW